MTKTKVSKVEALRPPFPEHMIGRSAPGDLTAIKLGQAQKELLQRQALDIFTIMSNAGYSFADSLAAVLMSGIQWGVSASKNPIRVPDRIIV
jgi:hypothetical protein